MTDFGRVLPFHKVTHQDGGVDEISVASLSGLLSNSQTALAHALGGAKHTPATLSALNALISNATLDTSSASRTPSAHKTSHQDGGADKITCALLAGRINYVDRGDPSDWDFTVSTFTTDATWRDLNVSSIVPAGAQALMFLLQVQVDVINAEIRFRKKSISNVFNSERVISQVADQRIYYNLLVFCDSNRVIQYYATNETFAGIYMVINGWLI